MHSSSGSLSTRRDWSRKHSVNNLRAGFSIFFVWFSLQRCRQVLSLLSYSGGKQIILWKRRTPRILTSFDPLDVWPKDWTFTLWDLRRNIDMAGVVWVPLASQCWSAIYICRKSSSSIIEASTWIPAPILGHKLTSNLNQFSIFFKISNLNQSIKWSWPSFAYK